MNDSPADARVRAEKVRGIADMMVSAHSLIRDQLRFWSTLIDLHVIVMSGWLSALSFAPDDLLKIVNPTDFKSQYVVGVLGVFTFCLSLVQLQLNLKGRSESHDNAAKEIARIKGDISTYLSFTSPELRDLDVLIKRYADVCEMVIKIPEAKFLSVKAHHKRKVEISKYIDAHPCANLTLLNIKMWIRDNVRFL